MIQIRKRDGRIKPFDFSRIHKAIFNALNQLHTIPGDHNDYTNRIEADIAGTIAKDGKDLYDVEEIQDIVVASIKKYDEKLASLYSSYREERTRVRERKSNLMQSVIGIMNSTNFSVMTENSNKQAQLASTQRDLIAGEVSKAYANMEIPQHLLDAHNSGLIKIHDLDYWMQPIYNCELINLEDMLQNGTVINKKLIRKPKSLKTAMTIATQISAQVASSTYGGQTISISHLAPFVRISKEKFIAKYKAVGLPQDKIDELVDIDLKAEIKDAVQTLNYQISTIMTTNGQAPFISLCLYISENPEYEEETVMLIEELFKQRIEGLENEYAVKATQTFPKLLYFLDTNNTYPGSKYYWLTQLAVRSTALRMNPDYISVKKMKEVIGYAFPPMGCRAFLSPFIDENGNAIFYGRGNLGVQSICLPYVALDSGGDMDKFWSGLDDALELARQMCELRYEKLRGVKANVAPILWQHGAIARLNHDDDILKAIDARGFTVTIGYSGLYETVKYLTGESHTQPKGFELAEKIMKYLRDKCEEFKKKQPHLRFALYGTPQESTTGWFHDRLKAKFGVVKDITDKGWITNSYHVDIREQIDAFTKIKIESKLQNYSTGGAVSYIETINMNKNLDALMQVVQYFYENIIYAEVNFESDTCGKCKYSGIMENDPKTLKWYCPQCGNDDQNTLSVIRRTCGYLGETEWTTGRKLDILNRVKHL